MSTDPVTETVDEPLWRPPDGGTDSRLAGFTRWLEARHDRTFADYDELWRWSTEELGQFWADVAEYFDVAHGLGAQEALAHEAMPGAVWFPGVQVNFARRILQAHADEEVALVATTEDGSVRELTGAELRRQVGVLAATLRGLGVGPGDRVAGFLPQTEHAVISFLATASLGAVWAVCAPDFGVQSVLDRLAQTEPTVLIAADGYHFGGRVHDRSQQAHEVLAGLPGDPVCVWVDYVGTGEGPAGHLPWSEAIEGTERVEPVDVAFEHPLWILFSSGTTGIPKGIVHGHGGVLVEQLKMMALMSDVGPGDRFFWYTSTAWMMWNTVVCSLLVGATAVLYDGSPQYPDHGAQWALAERLRLTHLGTSAGYLTACAVGGLRPAAEHDLHTVRFIGSTGSPLPAATARWVYEAASRTAQLVSSTGGTDIVTGLLGGVPTLPVWAGELSGPMLGVAVDSWDESGRPVRDRDGELVITRPMPTMPLSFWNDPDGSRYHDAYFATYDGVWRHGDWVEITSRGTAVVSGRSDSTLNRGGVRMGTADVYAAVATIPEVVESMMLGVEQADGGYWMPLFVQLAPGVELDDDLRARIGAVIAAQASRRHVPDEIIAVPGLPHTRTGKRLEVPLKRLFQGHPVGKVLSAGSIDDPSLIDVFVDLATTRLQPGGSR